MSDKQNEQQDDYGSASSPRYWYERERENGTQGKAGAVDIYWIDDGDGPVKLSRPIKCF